MSYADHFGVGLINFIRKIQIIYEHHELANQRQLIFFAKPTFLQDDERIEPIFGAWYYRAFILW